MRTATVIVLAGVALCLASTAVAAGTKEDIAAGKRLAKINCAVCHALERTGASPFPPAPPFRDVPMNYDPGELEDAFNDGIVASHPAMPDWKMTSDQARELAAYIMSFANEP